MKDRFNDGLPKESGVPKLAFKLADTELLRLIPECFNPTYEQADNNGPGDDLWDKGIDFPNATTTGTSGSATSRVLHRGQDDRRSVG